MKAKTLSVINELMYFEAVGLLLMIGQKLVPRLNLQSTLHVNVKCGKFRSSANLKE